MSATTGISADPVLVSFVKKHLCHLNREHLHLVQLLEVDREQMKLFSTPEDEELLADLMEGALIFSQFVDILEEKELDAFYTFLCLLVPRCEPEMFVKVTSQVSDPLVDGLMRLLETKQFAHVALFLVKELRHIAGRKRSLCPELHSWLQNFIRTESLRDKISMIARNTDSFWSTEVAKSATKFCETPDLVYV